MLKTLVLYLEALIGLIGVPDLSALVLDVLVFALFLSKL
jgi:hypothetical protein